jgi:AcrR family transcriptional regulator
MATTPKTDAKPMRADARRNRERLLEVAVERFGQDGTEASLEAIAKDAGVGIGTLYRHFPTRDALIEEAYRAEVARLAGAAPELLAELPADQALAGWMDRFVTYAAAKRGMSAALRSVLASESGLYADGRKRFFAALDQLLAAGQAAGTIRGDVDAEDVLRATGSIYVLPADAEWAARARRLLALLVDGLRYGA